MWLQVVVVVVVVPNWKFIYAGEFEKKKKKKMLFGLGNKESGGQVEWPV